MKLARKAPEFRAGSRSEPGALMARPMALEDEISQECQWLRESVLEPPILAFPSCSMD